MALNAKTNEKNSISLSHSILNAGTKNFITEKKTINITKCYRFLFFNDPAPNITEQQLMQYKHI